MDVSSALCCFVAIGLVGLLVVWGWEEFEDKERIGLVPPKKIEALPVVSALFVHPIKSCGGVRVEEMWVDERGPLWDRRWAFLGDHGRLATQRSVPGLARIHPRIQSSKVSEAGVELVLEGVDAKGNAMESLVVPIVLEGAEVVSCRMWGSEVRDLLVQGGEKEEEWVEKVVGIESRLRLVFLPRNGHRPIVDPYLPPPGLRMRPLIKSARGIGPSPREVPTGPWGELTRHTSFADGFPFLLVREASMKDLRTRIGLQDPSILYTSPPPSSSSSSSSSSHSTSLSTLKEESSLKRSATPRRRKRALSSASARRKRKKKMDEERELEGTMTLERFRPNIVVADSSPPWVEDEWRALEVWRDCGGEVVPIIRFRGLKRCARCNLPTVNPITGSMPMWTDVKHPPEPTKTLRKFRAGQKNDEVFFGTNLVHEWPPPHPHPRHSTFHKGVLAAIGEPKTTIRVGDRLRIAQFGRMPPQ